MRSSSVRTSSGEGEPRVRIICTGRDGPRGIFPRPESVPNNIIIWITHPEQHVVLLRCVFRNDGKILKKKKQ